MQIKIFLMVLLLFSPLFATVQNSIIPLMNQTALVDLNEKINSEQKKAIASLSEENRLRVMSFNMLTNLAIPEVQLDEKDRWAHRAPRLIEYLRYASPDLIGSQELQSDQIEMIIEELGDEYDYYGEPCGHEISAIFYKCNRFELMEGKTYSYTDDFTADGNHPFEYVKGFTTGRFVDRQTGQEFCVINTHLAFGDIEKRLYEARRLRDFVNQLDSKLPVIVMGDLNTFPFWQEHGFPFYDGDMILSILQESPIRDGMNQALLGHFGPIASTNYSTKEQRSFRDYGTPGVILDHILTNEGIQVVRHGIDPALVDGNFTSDHFPVICDLIIK